MRRVRPDWPSDTERHKDLAHHIALEGAIDRALAGRRDPRGTGAGGAVPRPGGSASDRGCGRPRRQRAALVVKLRAGRPQDLEDAIAVLRALGGELDAAWPRAMLRELERALDRSDLVAAFGSALAQARRP